MATRTLVGGSNRFRDPPNLSDLVMNVATIFCNNKHSKLSVPLPNHTSYTNAFIWGFASYRNVTWRFITHYATHVGFKSSFGSKAAAGFKLIEYSKLVSNSKLVFNTVNLFQKISHHCVISLVAIPICVSERVTLWLQCANVYMFIWHEYWLVIQMISLTSDSP